jgi:hypothetical protein
MRVSSSWIALLAIFCATARSDQIVTLTANSLQAQGPVSPIPDPSTGLVYVCPMDPDVRSHDPGTCRRCGMTLVAGVPEPVEFHLDVAVTPRSPIPNSLATIQFFVRDPWKDRPVSQFNVVHEKLFHAFVVSQDLQFFEHGHPTLVSEGLFQYPITFPKAGMYRVLGDFYPVGATPQLTTETVIVGGNSPAPPHLIRDYSTKRSENAQVSLVVVPDQAVSGTRTQLRFSIDPGEGLEKYLGVWAHLLAVSDDLIDMMHEHPFLADGGPKIEFELVFPRPRPYRLWLQFQKNGVVNTVHFDVPVERPPRASGLESESPS